MAKFCGMLTVRKKYCILCTVKFDFLEDVYLDLEDRMLVFGGSDASIWRIGC